METDELSLNEKKGPRTSGFIRASFYVSFLALLLSSLSLAALHINDWHFNEDDDFAVLPLLFVMCIFLLPVVSILGFVSCVGAFFTPPRLKNLGLAALTILFALLASVAMPAFQKAKGASATFSVRSLKSLAQTLTQYAEKNEGKLPPATTWPEVLKKIAPDTPRHLTFHADVPEGLSCYAYNRNTEGFRLNDLPGDVVLLFETEAGESPAGGPELLSTEYNEGRGCVVLFTDMRVRFVKARKIPSLRWKP